MRISTPKLAFLIFTICVLQACSAIADVRNMDREECIQLSELIFTGTVVSKTCRWNDNRTLILTDYEFEIEDVLFGQHKEKNLILSFAGGELNDLAINVSDIPEFYVGERSLLMVADTTKNYLSPITGAFHGKFSAQRERGVQYIVDAFGRNILDPRRTPITFDNFVDIITAEIPVAKAKPRRVLVIPENIKLLPKDLPCLRYETAADRAKNTDAAKVESEPKTLPIRKYDDETDSGFASPSKDFNLDVGEDGAARYLLEDWWRGDKCVMEPWPSSFGITYQVDQTQMSYWNRYGRQIFRVTPTDGSFGSLNLENEMVGWLTSSQLNNVYGMGWPTGTLAVCIRTSIPLTNWLLETDIIFNEEVAWSLDDFDIYNNFDVYSINNTLSHELGHAIGLEHRFSQSRLSIMLYSSHNFRVYNRLYLDDVVGMDSVYPREGIRDGAIHMYRDDGNGDFENAELTGTSGILQPGDTFGISNVVIENLGTSDMTPNVEVRLVNSLFSTANSRVIQSYSFFSPIPARSSSNLALNSITVPFVEPGIYYLYARVVDPFDEFAGNDRSWLFTPIEIIGFQAPPNDNFVNSQPVFDLTASFTGSNQGATTENGGEPNGGAPFFISKTVWWNATPAARGILTIDTSGSNFDTVIDVFTGPSVDNLTPVPGGYNNDYNGGQTSQVQFEVQEGQRYEIRIAARDNPGIYELNFDFEEIGPPNDNFENATYAIVYTCDKNGCGDPRIGSNVDGTLQLGEPLGGSTEAEKSVWFYAEVDRSGELFINTYQSDFDTILDVFTGSNLFDLVPVEGGHNDDWIPEAIQSVVFIDAEPGELYFIRMSGKNGAEGNYQLNVQLTPNSPAGNFPVHEYNVFRGIETSEFGNDPFLLFDAESVIDPDNILAATFNPGFTINSEEAPVWLEFEGDAGELDTSFEMYSSSGTPGLTYEIELWDYNLKQWAVVAVSEETFNSYSYGGVSVPEFAISDGEPVRVRVGWRRTGFTINFPWEVRVDYAGFYRN